MSLYNLLHGVNPFTPLLLASAGVTMGEVPRFRDTHLFERKPGEWGVAIYTRTGGGNRECYCNEWRSRDGKELLPIGEHDEGCYPAMNLGLTRKPTYLYDEDDDFDCTYATFYFRVPDEMQPLLRGIVELGGQSDVPADKWQQLFAHLKGGEDNEITRNAMDVARPIIEQIVQAVAPRTEGR